MVEVLKQGRFEPMPVEEQVVEIYAGTQGFVDDIPVENVRTFLAGLRDFVKAQHPDLLSAIREQKVLDEANEAILRSDIADFHQTMAPSEPNEPGERTAKTEPGEPGGTSAAAATSGGRRRRAW